MAFIDQIRKITTTTKYRPFAESADHELLAMLNDSSVSKQAFEEFYYRFKDFVFKICQKCCSAFGNSTQLADDIFQNTFLKVLYKGYTFRVRERSTKNNYTAEIKAWLSRIAKNELINFLRKNPDEKSLTVANRLRSYEHEIAEISDTQSNDNSDSLQPPSIQQHILEKGLSILTGQEKMVLMTYMMYYNPQAPNNHLPDEVIKNLTGKLGVKAGSLRQIKSRALKKIMKIKEASTLTN
ncbi:MAG TPA: sigma-70 family RNA polymerase sigma factor [Mucilaginibacter sp.]